MHDSFRQRIAVLTVSVFSIAAAGAGEAKAPGSGYPTPLEVSACGAGSRPPLTVAMVSPLSTGPVLTLEFRDADTGVPIAVRAGVFDATGAAVAPDDPAGHLFQSVLGYSHFVCDGNATVTVPGGVVTVKAGRGFEYSPVIRTFSVENDTTVVVELERLLDMNARGWYAADTHVHIAHPPVVYNVQPAQVLTMMDAEGLNFVSAMEEQPYFAGAPDPASTADRILYFSKEERNAHLAHLSLPGLKQWIPDQTCSTLNHACARTLNSSIAATVHAQDPHALVIATHPFPTWNVGDVTPWPGGGVWRGMSLDLLGGCIDAVDLLCYSHLPPPAGVADYQHALTLGFRVPPSAGTDASIGNGGSLPAGGYRVYVHLDDGVPFSYETWADAFRAGRSFVTNYPLVTEFEVGGAAPGDELVYGGGGVEGHVSVSCVKPIAQVDILGPTGVLTTIVPEGGSDARFVSADFTVDPSYGGWIAARVTGAGGGWHAITNGGLFAQTGPIYVVATDPQPARGTGFEPLQLAALRFQSFTEEVSSFFLLAEFGEESAAVFDSLCADAVETYQLAWPDPPDPFDMIPHDYSLPHGMPIVRSLTPRLSWKRPTDPDPGDTATYTVELGSQPDFSGADVFPGIPDTTLVVPPENALADGAIYYWRVRATDGAGLERIASPGLEAFLVDIVLTGAVAPAPTRWDLVHAHPNPFNPTLHVSYSVPPGAQGHALRVYDARGRLVRTLYAGERPAGVYDAVWGGDGDGGGAVASGVYFLRLEPDSGAPVTRKVVLLK